LEEKSSGQSFVKQASILAAAGIISRIIGFFYRPPLTALIGDSGMGIYSIGYNIYNLLIVLSSAGLPVAISKMASERLALRRYNSAHKVFKTSLIAASSVGLVLTILLFIFARPIANFYKGGTSGPDSYLTLLTLSPTITVVAALSVYRGYFQGMENNVPTALSQIIEQLINAFFSVFLAWYLMKTFNDTAYGAAGGTAGTGIGAVIGLLVIIAIFRLNLPSINRRMTKEHDADTSEDELDILKELLFTALPIIAGIAIFSFTNIVDSVMAMRRLQAYLPADEAMALYGQLANKYVSISNLPVSVSSSIATACIPSVAASRVLSKTKEASMKINTAMRLAMSVSIPAACGIGIFSTQILLLLFRSYPDGGTLLRVGAISIVFLALYQISTGMLQGLNKIHIPVISVISGVAVKIPLNYILLGNPKINVLGTVISTIVCYIIASAINITALIRITKIRLDFAGILIKPAFASLIMGMFSFICYYLVYYLLPSNTLCISFAIILGIVSYFTVMLFTRALKANDILLMPGGKRIISAIDYIGLGGYLDA